MVSFVGIPLLAMAMLRTKKRSWQRVLPALLSAPLSLTKERRAIVSCV